MPRYDLHCHSTWSDGLLTPAAIVGRAAGRGVDVLSLTDHDEIGGLAEARAAAVEAGIGFVDGVEVSVTWNDVTLHVVGLRVDPLDSALIEGLARVRNGRLERARRMADGLAAVGIPGAFEGARKYVTSDRLISRTHFARFLVETGRVGEVKDVFKRYLTRGKPGYVAHEWATLPDAIRWIRGAGGHAVLAHPGRYPFTPTAMRRLLAEFRDTGGEGVEVLSSSHTPAVAAEYAAYARSFDLAASVGSDYHGPGESWVDLGDLRDLPDDLRPIWRDW
jgi:predicted metal-dependent phosphoesterase TrpH